MKARKTLWKVFGTLPALALAAVLGCGQDPAEKGAGGGDRPAAAPTSDVRPATPPAPAEAAPAKSSAAPVVAAPVEGTATIVGKVRYAGDPPKRRPINFGPEKKCCDAHKTPPLDDTLVVSPNKEVQWALVRIGGRVPGAFPPPKEKAVLDQHGCIFTPHVLAVQTGQEIEIRNSDPLLHNVRCEATLNPSFNRNLPKEKDTTTVSFSTAETGVKFKCDVHFWMGGFVHVLPHPFFAVTGEDGGFTIARVPPGTYKLETWHEKLGKLTQDVTVKAGDVQTVEFVYPAK
jgi:plastocyanin